MATTKDKIVYRLNALCRFDEDVKAFVGYIPRLRVYSQAPSKDVLTKALHSTATQFIVLCANKGILASVLREAGAVRPTTVSIDQVKAAAQTAAEQDLEFIAVMGYEECPQPIEVEVPLSLIAAQEAMAVTA